MLRWDCGPAVLAAMRGPSSLRSFAGCVSWPLVSRPRAVLPRPGSVAPTPSGRRGRSPTEGIDPPADLEGEERRRLAIASGGRRKSLSADEPADDAAPSAPGLLMLRHSAPCFPDRPLSEGGVGGRFNSARCAPRLTAADRRVSGAGRFAGIDGASRSVASSSAWWSALARRSSGRVQRPPRRDGSRCHGCPLVTRTARGTEASWLGRATRPAPSRVSRHAALTRSWTGDHFRCPWKWSPEPLRA
jgi:hypothetical protein